MKKLSTGAIVGILFIVFGCIFGLRAFGVDIDIFFRGWWTLFIIVPSILGLRYKYTKVVSIIGLGLGILLFLSSQNIIEWWMFGRLFPAFVFIVIGLLFIFGNKIISGQNRLDGSNVNGDDRRMYSAVLTTRNIDFSNQKFERANISTILGSVQFDIRKAVLEEEIVINASACLGSIDILVPADAKIILNSTPILGSVNNEVIPPKQGREMFVPVIKISATSVLGGINIK